MARVLRAWAIKGRENSVHKSPYGPPTRLIRGMHGTHDLIVLKHMYNEIKVLLDYFKTLTIIILYVYVFY